jgi:DNA polymerase delta subunit 3
MKDVFDEDNEVEEQPTAEDAEKAAASRKARKDRETRLRQMMDDDDEPMADAPDAPPEGTESEADVVVEAAEEVDDTAALDAKPKPESLEPDKETVVVSDGRRRGRRRVTKKVTVKDEEGYLVTTEEPAWESFSEEEQVVNKPKPLSMSTAGKKKSTTKGQGNIMSFFGKK